MTDNCSNATAFDIASIQNPLNEDERFTLLALYVAGATISALANVWSLAVLPARAYQVLYKFCLASLSVSDLIVGVLVSIDNAVRLGNSTMEWVLGESLCPIVPFLTTSCVLTSSLTMTCVAVDRYLALRSARDKFKFGIPSSLTLVLLVWVVSLGASIPMYLDYTADKFCIIDDASSLIWACSSCSTFCVFNRDVTYFSIIYGVIFVPILIVFFCSYIRIALYAWRARFRFGAPSPSSAATDITDTAQTIRISETRGQRKASTKKKLRTFRIVIIILTTFIICRLPQFTYNLITIASRVENGRATVIIKYVLSILTVINTAINPFLYSFLDDVLILRRKLGYGVSDCMKFGRNLRDRCCIRSKKATYEVYE